MTADPLATFLVREGVLPQARVDEAQERQVLAGGTLDTALLELGLLDETRLIDVLGRAYHTRAVDKGALGAVDKSVTSLFPRRLAEKHGVVPIDVSGRRLTVALAGPPDLALLDEIGFMLSVYVKPAVTTQARLAWAQAKLYGIPLPARLEALLERTGEDTASVKAAVDAWHARAVHKPVQKPAPPSPPPEPATPRAPDTSGWTVNTHAGLAPGAPSSPRLEVITGSSMELEAEAAARAASAVADPDAARDEKRRKERVLWTVDDAIAELALAEDRDAMLDVVLRFAYRRLSTVAVFVLTRSTRAPASADGSAQAFVGWDVIDPLLGRKDIASFELPADHDNGGALAQVLEMKSPFLGPLKREDPLVRLFGRRARAVILVPILVGDRFIGALYGDSGAHAIPPSSLAELHMVVPRLGKGLGNLILRKKKQTRAASDLKESVIVGKLVETGEAEENIAVSRPRPPRALPTIEIDISEVAGFEPITAPATLSSDPAPLAERVAEPTAGAPPAPSEPAPGEPPPSEPTPSELTPSEPPAPAPKVFAWADGRDDDEDVRLDDLSLAQLFGAKPASSSAAKIELGLDEVVDEPAVEDDADALIARALTSVPEADLSPAQTPSTEVPGAVAPSPGASARESLLVATHAQWLAHDDATLDELVGQLHRPGEKESQQKSAVAAVVAHGERALPSLARYFPGVMTVHPFGTMDHRPEVEDLSDCLACLVKLGPALAAPILTAELAHDDRLHRWAAVWALSSLKVPGALSRLAQKLFDPEPVIASLALEVLDGYRAEPGFDKMLAQVRDLVRRGDPFEKERAIVAVAELRDREALTALVDLLGTRPKELAQKAHDALVDITKQDFGTGERRWRAWIADNASVPRTRWLIVALSSKDDDVRKAAQAELNRITGQFFGYRWDAPRAERERSVTQWNEWWDAQQKEAPGRWP